MTSESKKPKLLTTAEVSQRYEGNLSVRTLNNWRSQGKGPRFLRLEGKILYPVEELEKWEQESLYSSTSNYKAAS